MNNISSFNSTNFKSYPERDNKTSNHVISLCHYNDVIYFSTMSGLYSYDGVRYKTLSKRNKIFSLKFNENNNSLYYTIGNELYKINNPRSEDSSHLICKIPDSLVLKYISFTPTGSVYLSSNKGLYHFTSNKKLILLSSEPSFYSFCNEKGNLVNIDHYKIDEYNSQNQIIRTIPYQKDFSSTTGTDKSIRKILVSHSGDNIYILSPLLVHSSISGQEKDIKEIVKESNKLIQINLNFNSNNIRKYELPENLINPSTIINDSKGNIWIGTLSGLYYGIIPRTEEYLNIIPTVESVGNISMLNNKIIFQDLMFNGYTLDTLDIHTLKRLNKILKKLQKDHVGTIYSIQNDARNNYLFTTLKKGIGIGDINSDLYYLQDSNVSTFLCMTKDFQENVYCAGINGIYIWNGKSLKKHFENKKLDDVFIFDLTFQENLLWISTSNGLYMYDGSSLHSISENEGLHNISFSCVAFDKNKRIIAGTYESGIVIFEKMNGKYKIVDAYTKINGLSSNCINSIIVDKLNRTWVSTPNNINIAFTKNGALSIHNFRSNELIKNNIWDELKLFSDNQNHIYIAGKKGLIYFNVSQYQLDTSNNNKTIIDNIKINNIPLQQAKTNLTNKLFGVPENIEFAYTENNLSFELTAIDYENTDIKYQYYLSGTEEDWNPPSTDHQVNYRNLAPGKYTLYFRHISNNNFSQTEKYSFQIKPPFWRTIPFILFISALLSVLAIITYKRQITKLKRDNESKIREIEVKFLNLSLRSEVLLGQLKPHFIFNALGPLQNYILTSNKEKGIKYLNTLSHLLRSMLNHARELNVTLESEIEFLTHYLSQQQTEKNYKFNFTIRNEVENKLTKIPGLMIQPLLENCIQHGLSNSENNMISIYFKADEKKYIHVIVEENGPGFDLDKQLSLNKNNALNILNDRINLLAQIPISSEASMKAYSIENRFIIHLKIPIIHEN